MKYKINYYIILLGLIICASCDVSYNDGITDPNLPYGFARDIDPGFVTHGFQDVNTISIYDKYNYKVEYNRTYGISRELDIHIEIDEKALQDYNALYETNYQLIDSKYYSFPESISFEAKSKKMDFNVLFHPEKMVKELGLENTKKYVLPLKAIPVQTDGVIADSTKNSILLHVNISKPSVQVFSTELIGLEFVKNSGFDENVTVSGQLNFEGLDFNLISFGGSQEDVDFYNSKNGTNYTLLPQENYSFYDFTIDKDNVLQVNGLINGDNLGNDNEEYLLPCVLKSSIYEIKQEVPIYIVVKITDLLFTIDNAGGLIEAQAGGEFYKGKLTVKQNSLIADDIDIIFEYKPELVTQYNAKNNTSYKVLDSNRLDISESKLIGGTRSINVPFAVNMLDNKLEDGVVYLLPFVLQKPSLGSIQSENVVYVSLTKSLLGKYTVERLATFRERNFGKDIWLASECARAGDGGFWDKAIAKAQYGFAVDIAWDRGYVVLFSITEEVFGNDSKLRKIELYSFLESIGEGVNDIKENTSYYDTETGEVRLDFIGYESWLDKEGKETYVFTR